MLQVVHFDRSLLLGAILGLNNKIIALKLGFFSIFLRSVGTIMALFEVFGLN